MGEGSHDPNCDNYRIFFSTLTPSLTSILSRHDKVGAEVSLGQVGEINYKMRYGEVKLVKSIIR